MSRVASLLAVLLAFFVGIVPWAGENPTLNFPLNLIAVAGLLLGGHGAFRKILGLHIFLLMTSLVVLCLFLPNVFMHQRYWPDLVVILLGTVVMGIGLIGLVLDRYSGGAPSANGIDQ
jgi:hypothetical protein